MNTTRCNEYIETHLRMCDSVYVKNFTWNMSVYSYTHWFQLSSFIIFEWYLLHSVDCISMLNTVAHIQWLVIIMHWTFEQSKLKMVHKIHTHTMEKSNAFHIIITDKCASLMHRMDFEMAWRNNAWQNCMQFIMSMQWTNSRKITIKNRIFG